jgi:hypothetical protein
MAVVVTDRTARLRASFVRILIPGIEDQLSSGGRLPQLGSHRSQRREEAAGDDNDRHSVASGQDDIDNGRIDDDDYDMTTGAATATDTSSSDSDAPVSNGAIELAVASAAAAAPERTAAALQQIHRIVYGEQRDSHGANRGGAAALPSHAYAGGVRASSSVQIKPDFAVSVSPTLPRSKRQNLSASPADSQQEAATSRSQQLTQTFKQCVIM